jgi:hypothetical protein
MSRARVLLPFHALVGVVLTWPLAGHLTDSLPQGIEPVATVPLFNLWTLRWNQQQAGDLFRHYWDAPIFHPTPGAFALSEPQPLTGAFFTPIAWLTHNPTLAYNVTLLTILMLNGYAATRLARRIGVAPAPAALAGVVAQALPFVATQLGVLQLVALFPIFFVVDALLAWAPRGGWRWALGIGGWLAATFLTCGYYGLFTVVVVGIAGLGLIRRSWFTWSRLGELGLAAAVFAVLAAPVLIGQARYTDPYHRSEETILGLSAEPVDYVRLHPLEHGASTMPWLQDTGGTAHFLYPGTVLLLLAGVGFVLAFGRAARKSPSRVDAHDPPREPEAAAALDGADPLDAASPLAPTHDPAPGREDLVDIRRRVLFLLHALCLALVLSIGLRVDIGGFRPYDLLRDHVPGYRNLRSPFRFAALVQVFLVPLAAVALDALWRWRPVLSHADDAAGSAPERDDTAAPHAAGARPKRPAVIGLGAALAVLLIIAGVAEVSTVPQRLALVDGERADADWVTWLRDHPREGEPGDGSVAMVPFPANGAVESYEPTANAMLAGLDHGRPLVNGYSGLFPASYDELEQAMRSFPSVTSVQHLRAIPVTYVVVERSWLTPEAQGWMADWSAELTPVFQGTDEIIYRLNP